MVHPRALPAPPGTAVDRHQYLGTAAPDPTEDFFPSLPPL